MDSNILLVLGGNELHLPVLGERQLFERAVRVMQTSPERVNLWIHWNRKNQVCPALRKALLEALPFINKLRFRNSSTDAGSEDQEQDGGTVEREENKLLLDLCLEAALDETKDFHRAVDMLLSLFSLKAERYNILIDFYQHVKSQESASGVSEERLQMLLCQAAPGGWTIDLSEGRSSLLLEVLIIQPERKLIELRRWSGEESEVWTFLECLPYISQLSFVPQLSNFSEQTRFLVNLFCQAAEREQQREKILELLSSVCSYETFPLKDQVDDDEEEDIEDHNAYQCDFRLELYCHVKDYETQTGSRVLPALQPVFQSAPAVWTIDLSKRKASVLLEVLKLQSGKKPVELRGWSDEESEVWSFLKCLPYMSELSFTRQWSTHSGQAQICGNLFCRAAEREQQTGEKILELLSSVCSYETFPLKEYGFILHASFNFKDIKYQCDFLLELYSHVKDYETPTGSRVLQALQPVFQSAPPVWTIDLSERKASVLLEVLKLQSGKKPVELRGWSDEESEVWSFLKCLPYMSQLSFAKCVNRSEQTRFLVNLFCRAAEREQQTGEKILQLLSSVCSYETFRYGFYEKNYQCDFLLDLYSHVKDYETQTGRRVLPAFQPVFQSAPAVWTIDLSERKASVLLEVMKLQSGKKPVELRGWSDEESEVWSFLKCLPYMSELSFSPEWLRHSEPAQICGNLFYRAAEREKQTGEKILELLSSVCSYKTFPLKDLANYHGEDNKYQCEFLLNLYSHVKDYETQTGSRVLPALQPVFQSAPAVWTINLSERKASVLLEVMKLQSGKKPVELTGWSDEESEVWSFLKCLPYMSQLSFTRHWPELSEQTRFLVNLFCRAAEREQQTGVKILELLSSVCSYQTFPLKDLADYYGEDNKYQCDFLLDLCSHVKDYETQTGSRVLPAFQPVFQSAPAVWTIDLSERKTSVLLEVMKLQSGKKPVELRGWSDEESEVWSFLKCLPYMSQLSFTRQWSANSGQAQICGNLFCRAAEREQQTGEKILELLSSVCSYETFPLNVLAGDDFYKNDYQCYFLLDLYSHVKDYETQTGSRVLPALQPVFQSAPVFWIMYLSERKASVLLEVMKLQSGKKPVELTGWSDEESEVWSFLKCLPYMSQLSFSPLWSTHSEQAQICGNLFCRAAEREQQTGEKILELLSSVCRYETFPLKDRGDYYDEDNKYQCYFLLNLYSHVKDYETQTGSRVLPAFQPVFQSAPPVWTIDLSERKASVLLEVMKLQSGKKPVELRGWSDEESEVWSFLKCLPYMSQLSFTRHSSTHSGPAEICGNLFCRAAEREQQTGEKILELLSSVCRYETFPYRFNKNKYQCDFLLQLYSHVKDYETQTGSRVLPALQPVFQSAPPVWTIDLSERKASVLLEVMKLQSGKKPVELTGWSYEESEVWSFLKCLPYMSQLRCDLEFFHFVCTSVSVRSTEVAQLASLLRLMGFTLVLTGELPRKTCRSVGRVLGLCGSSVDLILTPSKISLKGASLIFRHTAQLHSLRLSESTALLLCRLASTQKVANPVCIEELSLVLKTSSQRVLMRAVSSVASLLRYWAVKCLDLTEVCIPAHNLMTLLLHRDPLTIKLSVQCVQQLTVLIHEIQDKDLTQSFLSKVGGDLTSCSLDWELLHYLLQHSSTQSITVDMRKSKISEKSIINLLPFLDRIVFKRPSPSFVLSAIRESYRTHARHCIPSLLKSLAHVISLTCRELDTVDCAALLFILKHSDGVKLNLLWTSIPQGEIQALLLTLENISHLSVDRNLLLRLLQGCTASGVQQGAAAAGLLRTLQHRLDLSCSSRDELSVQEHRETLCLGAGDCRAISTVLSYSSQETLLSLQDCEVEDSGLELLFPVLNKVHLSTSKAVLVQMVSQVPVGSERDTAIRAQSLCRALGGELDLSETTLDQRACDALVWILDFSEGLTKLNLSHCQLTDQLLHTLIPHLHKVQDLDVSHNKITDALTDRLLQLVSINTSITVRVFSNNIMDRTPFLNDKRNEMW
ncbi:uncharacterized protein LOC115367766 [Myripristis murdjan]|uniref:uncharacterized protein LOC115367766 n=1 Tax=Myripristis murdjan TaxID=586833 RepID=UPI001175E43C|nr:uncharacterized protein LOC115367766 [Myripristis murdjan]